MNPNKTNSMYDPKIFIHKTVLMQRLLDAVSRGGYTHYVSGQIHLAKAQRFVDKFAEKYAININVNQRAYRKRKGAANCVLFLYLSQDKTSLDWWLLVTKGEGLVWTEETLLDVRDKRTRIRVPGEYELIRHTRRAQTGGGLGWTWQMTKETFQNWYHALQKAARSKSPVKAEQLMFSLRRTPGFHKTRSQVGKLMVSFRREWRRRHSSLKNAPTIEKLRYVERLKNDEIYLSEILNLYGQSLNAGERNRE